MNFLIILSLGLANALINANLNDLVNLHQKILKCFPSLVIQKSFHSFLPKYLITKVVRALKFMEAI